MPADNVLHFMPNDEFYGDIGECFSKSQATRVVWQYSHRFHGVVVGCHWKGGHFVFFVSRVAYFYCNRFCCEVMLPIQYTKLKAQLLEDRDVPSRAPQGSGLARGR